MQSVNILTSSHCCSTTALKLAKMAAESGGLLLVGSWELEGWVSDGGLPRRDINVLRWFIVERSLIKLLCSREKERASCHSPQKHNVRRYPSTSFARSWGRTVGRGEEMVVAWAPEGGCTVAVTLDISLDRIWEADLVANGVVVVARLL